MLRRTAVFPCGHQAARPVPTGTFPAANGPQFRAPMGAAATLPAGNSMRRSRTSLAGPSSPAKAGFPRQAAALSPV